MVGITPDLTPPLDGRLTPEPLTLTLTLTTCKRTDRHIMKPAIDSRRVRLRRSVSTLRAVSSRSLLSVKSCVVTRMCEELWSHVCVEGGGEREGEGEGEGEGNVEGEDDGEGER